VAKNERNSGLPSASGSPFKTKNFNKFFFGIMIAAIVIAIAIMAYLSLAARHQSPGPGPTSRLRLPHEGRIGTSHLSGVQLA
jgi:hypothetical protein